MRVTLRYGETGLPLTLPDAWDVTVAVKPPMPLLADPEKTLQEALASPVACPPLADLAKGKRSVCILICDITRPVPNKPLLEGILRVLRGAGVPDAAVTILVATGLHRPNEGEELLRLVGSRDILDSCRVENHFASRTEDHVFLGETPGGVPVGIDRRFVEADLRIVTGLVEPHFMAGFSGGRKVIAPGICHESTIRTFHNARIMGDAAARNLNLRGNPLHEAQRHILALLSPVYAVNVVIDDERRPALVNFGEAEASHTEAVDFVRPYSGITVSRLFSTIVTCAAGAPLDLNYYQTVKGLVGVKEALAPGGRIFIASSCRDGLGSAEFRRSQTVLCEQGVDAFLAAIARREKADVDEWETQKLTEVLRLGSAVLYSPALSPEDRALTGIGHTNDLEGSVAQWVAARGDNRVLVVPEGPYIIPLGPDAERG
ncbi:conserved hypothetical protein [uncultured delta proteobacterium]|uniref:Uncharacterized protein n=1 Tax=uncultured delta proteobacterium TaxID=34034 RepID=A0A212KAF2_9DELT|nr:conserved hypothetical protein [uncultured delta proteobacterium]